MTVARRVSQTVRHAGNATLLNDGGQTNFFAESNAENATVEMNGSFMSFTGLASAGNGNFTLNSASVSFEDISTAGSATFTANDGQINFFHSATAPNATLIINNGAMTTASPLGGTSRVVLNESALNLNLLGTVTLGSIEGSGQINLNHNNNELVVGTNNLSTVFSGTITGFHLTESLNKVGLGHAHARQGPIDMAAQRREEPPLEVEELSLLTTVPGSGTGIGGVTVSDGTLGGSGIIAGAVGVGVNQYCWSPRAK